MPQYDSLSLKIPLFCPPPPQYLFPKVNVGCTPATQYGVLVGPITPPLPEVLLTSLLFKFEGLKGAIIIQVFGAK
jgi:hypothetical protein